MRREHERFLESRGIHHLQHDVKRVTVETVEIVHFDQLDVVESGFVLYFPLLG